VLRGIVRKIIRRQPEPVQIAVRNLLIAIRMARVARASRPQFQALKNQQHLKLHLAWGHEIRDGWINVGLNMNGTTPPMPLDVAPDTRFVPYDLSSGRLPFDDGSCELIYSSHVLEHLDYQDGLRLMRDYYHLLEPGGVLRAALPDFRRMFRAYLDNDYEHLDVNRGTGGLDHLPGHVPDTGSIVDHVNDWVYRSGERKCIYDEEKICLVLRWIGFESVAITDHKGGLDPASEIGRRHSFYVEAVKMKRPQLAPKAVSVG
jgi:predicted SAM-dependent methyltransferase